MTHSDCPPSRRQCVVRIHEEELNDRTATNLFRGLRVLVAEDDLLIAQLIGNILVSLGCTVIGPVDDLDEALQAIRTNDIDGALLDVQLGEATSIRRSTNWHSKAFRSSW